LLKRHQRGFPIIGDIFIVSGARAFQLGAVSAARNQWLQCGQAQRPNTARSIQKLRDVGALSSTAGAERDTRIESRFRNAYQRVRRCNLSFGSCDIRAALQKLRR